MGQIITDLSHHLLVATNKLNGSFFDKSVIYICSHDDKSTMGMVINRAIPQLSFNEVAEVTNNDGVSPINGNLPIFCGGPVAKERGFIIHSKDYRNKETVSIDEHINISTNNDIVHDIAVGNGPKHVNFCLGYSGWAAHQLEKEVAGDSWFVLPADPDILFNTPPEKRYDACLAKLGLNRANFVGAVGLA